MGDFPNATVVDSPRIRVRDRSMPWEHDNAEISVTDRLPPALKRVIVTSPKFRCLGYIDTNNIWRSASDDKEIEGVTAWQEFP